MAKKITVRKRPAVDLILDIMDKSTNLTVMGTFVTIAIRAYAQAVKDAPVEMTPNLIHPPDWLKAAEEVIAVVDNLFLPPERRTPGEDSVA